MTGSVLGQAERMEISVNIAQFREPRPIAVVFGHERSGNHFPVNAIAEVCGYKVFNWISTTRT